MIVYIHPKCSTCKDALHFLEKKTIAFTTKDITQTPPALVELQAMLDYHEGNLKKLLNTSGLLYREMELSKKLPEMSLQAVLALLNQHGMLVKRPFLIGRNVGLTGFNSVSWSKVL